MVYSSLNNINIYRFYLVIMLLKELLGTDVEVFKKEYTHNIAE